MKNYIQDGDTVTAIAPYALASGAGCLIGSLFGVAAGPAASGASVELLTEGVFDLDKTAAEAWSFGDKVYWDATAKTVTKTASGNTLIGVALADAANPSATGRVRLNGSFA